MPRHLSLAAALAILAPASALAQTAPAATPANSAAAPDVVLLKNGGMLRGTISELIPGDSVEIITASGQKRRYSMSEVQFAGPASQMPGASAPQGQPAAAPVPPQALPPIAIPTLKLTATQTGVRYHRRTGTGFAVAYGYGYGAVAQSASYEDLCTAPCELELKPGSYILALSLGSGRAIESKEVTVTHETSGLHGEYISRQGTRVGGLFVMLGSLVASLALLPFSFDSEYGLNLPVFLTSMGILTVGSIAGLVMMVIPDEAKITPVNGPAGTAHNTVGPGAIAKTPVLAGRMSF